MVRVFLRRSAIGDRGFHRSCATASGSLAMLAAIRRASSRVSSVAAARRARLLLAGDVGQRLPVGVAAM